MNINLQLFTLVTVTFITVFHYSCNAEQDEKKFRMQKLNLIWEKASKKLPKQKLKSLFTDLKYQDKEELNLKKLKAENMDKDGLKEAFVYGSLNAILVKYDLVEDFNALRDSVSTPKEPVSVISDSYVKSVFKDKKLNKLWLKAEQQGFTEAQLKMLKEEFQHHQTKIDEYYQLMAKIDGKDKEESSNMINMLEAEEGNKKWKTDGNPHQYLKEKHQELKASYDHLNSKIIPSYKNLEFEEPQVNTLWEMAKNTSFTEDELESLRRELHHFEHRIKKYKNLAEQELNKDNENNIHDAEREKRKKKVKEYEYKVSKIKTEIADRILAHHSEL